MTVTADTRALGGRLGDSIVRPDGIAKVQGTFAFSSDLVAECFELARDIRELDMRASPYDLADLGFDPVAVETAAGKAEYASAQQEFASRGAPLRAALIEECERLLSV